MTPEEARVVVARWIGQSGYVRVGTDHDKAWLRMQSEADGFIDFARESGYSLVPTADLDRLRAVADIVGDCDARHCKAVRAALGDRAVEEERPFDAKRMTHAWAILESRVRVGDSSTEAWEPDRYNAAAFVAALLVEYAALGDRAAEEGR